MSVTKSVSGHTRDEAESTYWQPAPFTPPSASPPGITSQAGLALIGCVAFVGLYLAKLYSYNLFHSLVEFFSVVIACGVFLFAWNSRRVTANGYLLFVGIAYLFVGGVDLVHTLAYRGMGVFVGFDADLPTQLWIGARYLEALSLLVAPLFLRLLRLRPVLVFASFTAVVGLFFGSVFYWRVFPACFVEGQGLTPFKVASEYTICLLLLGAALLLWRRREHFDREVSRLLLASIGVTIIQELAFTLYTDPYGLLNMVGHFLKIVAFYLIYRAIIATGLIKPFGLLLRDLQQTNERLAVANIHALEQAERAHQHAIAAEGASQRVSTILESITDAFFALDLDWRFTYINAEAERLLRRRRAELIGASAFEAFPEAVGTRFEEESSRALAEKTSVEFVEFYQPLGAWFQVHAYPSPEGLAVYFQDVTKQKAAEAERERLLVDIERRAAELDASLTAIADGLVIYGPNGEIVRMNRFAEEILGVSPEEQGQSGANGVGEVSRYELLDGRPAPLDELPQTRALQGEVVPGVVLGFRRPARAVRWLLISAAPIKANDGALLGAVSNFADVTALHVLQAQQAEMISLISHDLRNPLTTMLGQAQLLQRALGRQGLEREEVSVAAILRSGQRMNSMIQDLVESTRLSSGQLELRLLPTDLGSLLLDICRSVGTPEERPRVQLECSDRLPIVMVDPQRFERAVVNLISNALKYSAPDTPVVVRAHLTEDEVVISVIDRGVGIPPEDLPHLFQKFRRASTAAKAESLGLGLYITRALVEAHAGRVWVESGVGKGSTFSVALPVALPNRLPS